MESINYDSHTEKKPGCSCILFIAVAIILFLCISKCIKSQGEQNRNSEVQKQISSFNISHKEDCISGISSTNIDCDSTNTYPILKKSTTLPHFNAKSIDEARKEGLEHGYDDGEEDGMNNDEDDSYDDSCPYHGKMKKAYIEGYHEGYEEGWEDGQDSFLSYQDDI